MNAISRTLVNFLVFFCAYGAMGIERPLPNDPSWPAILSAPSTEMQLDLLGQKARIAKYLHASGSTIDSVIDRLRALHDQPIGRREHTRIIEMYPEFGPLLTKSK